MTSKPFAVAVLVLLGGCAGCGGSARHAAPAPSQSPSSSATHAGAAPGPGSYGASAIACQSSGQELEAAAVAYVGKNGDWPGSLAALVTGGYLASPPPTAPVATKGYYFRFVRRAGAAPVVTGLLTGLAGSGVCFRSRLR